MADGRTEDTPAVDCGLAAERYLQRFGWPCTAYGFAVWTLAGQAFDALDVPATIGSAVLSALRRDTGCAQDVIEIPGEPGLWRFLVQPQRYTPRALLAELASYGATYLTNADRIELPPTLVEAGELRWVRPPIGGLSALHTVIAALP